MGTSYPEEILTEWQDDGTMPANRDELAEAVVGHRIVSAEVIDHVFVITLDTGRTVRMTGQDDCCASTELDNFLLHPDMVDHVITGVGTTEEYETWHVYADMGDVLELCVSWSGGNVGYYAYGFVIKVED